MKGFEQFFRTLVAVPAPRILEETVEEVSLVPRVQISARTCEQIVQVRVPKVAEHLGARFADVPVPRILKENVEMSSLAPHEQMSERICKQIVEFLCPQISGQCAALSVKVQVPRILKDIARHHRVMRAFWIIFNALALHFFGGARQVLPPRVQTIWH